MNNKYLELLSPSRDLQTAKKAIESGADAVYIGGPAFGARSAATNSLDDLKELCDFAHLFGAKVHLTFNTLFYDNELDDVKKLLEELSKISLDVLIVQDPALFKLDLPKNIEVHASTQCLIKTPQRLKFYRDLGCAQAVLPREMSIDEIKNMHESCTDIRLEAFVAGALCVSESGNCFISEYMTNRSANRGSCAQICRLPMELLQNDKVIANGHLLSLKDNLAKEHLLSLINAGVSSFKIEGRLKDPAYVMNMTAYFRKLLDEIIEESHGLYQRSSKGSLNINFKSDPNKTFNRGFTEVMFDGDNSDMVNTISPKFIGPYIGQVQSIRYLGPDTILRVNCLHGIEIHNGDGLCFIDKNQRIEKALTGFRVNSVKGKDLIIRGRVRILNKEKLYRNVDTEFLKELEAPKAVSRVLNYSLKAVIEKDCLTLSAKDELGREASVSTEFVKDADFVHYKNDRLENTLKKRLNPNTNLEHLEILGDACDLYLPLSKVNALRREVLTDCFKKTYHRADFKEYKKPQVIPNWPEKEIDPRLCLNTITKDFYKEAHTDIGSLDNPKYKVVMTCKHCLVKTVFNKCIKDGAKASNLTLKIGPSLFKVKCDCRACRMMIVR